MNAQNKLILMLLFYACAVGCHKFDQFLPKRLWHNTGGETTFCQWTELGRSWFKWSVTLFHSLFFWMLYIKSSCVMLPLIWLVGMFFGWCKFSLSLSLSLSLCVFILGKWINSDGTTLAYTNFLLFFSFFFSCSSCLSLACCFGSSILLWELLCFLIFAKYFSYK